jgi:RNA-binding protein YhbY
VGSVEATLHVGKEGLDKIVGEARDQLEARNRIKVRVNRPMVQGRMKDSARDLAEELAIKTGSRVVDVRGRTFILEKIGDVDEIPED